MLSLKRIFEWSAALLALALFFGGLFGAVALLYSYAGALLAMLAFVSLVGWLFGGIASFFSDDPTSERFADCGAPEGADLVSLRRQP